MIIPDRNGIKLEKIETIDEKVIQRFYCQKKTNKLIKRLLYVNIFLTIIGFFT